MARLSLYQDFARTALSKLLYKHRQAPLDIDVSITGGLHAGSVITLAKPEFVIGPSETGDVMLLDPGAAGEPVTVSVERSLLGSMVTLSSARSDLAVNQQPVDIKSGAKTFRIPCTLDLGGVPIRFTLNEVSIAAGQPAMDMIKIGALACVCIVTLGFATGWGQPSQSNFDISSSENAVKRTAPSNLAAGTITSRVITSLIEKSLADHGLSNYLTPVTKSPQVISIVGNLPKDMRDNWHAARAQLHEVDGDMLVLPEFKTIPGRPELPAIASVRFGANPGLIFADKTTMVVGQTITDGWRIADITETGFVLDRFGVKLTVDY